MLCYIWILLWRCGLVASKRKANSTVDTWCTRRRSLSWTTMAPRKLRLLQTRSWWQYLMSLKASWHNVQSTPSTATERCEGKYPTQISNSSKFSFNTGSTTRRQATCSLRAFSILPLCHNSLLVAQRGNAVSVISHSCNKRWILGFSRPPQRGKIKCSK